MVNTNDMEDSLSRKTVLITGSTDGLGKLIARHLVLRGANVLLHGRNSEKGEAVLNELQSLTKNIKLVYYNADYASLKEVKDMGEAVVKDNKQIDILINNVGIGKGQSKSSKRELSKDGIELRFAVNYVAHVLLTEKLMPLFKNGTSAIINVASIGQEPVNYDNLMLEHGYEGYFAYKQSKTALIMYTFDLAARLKDRQINVNAVHPASLMNTKMVTNEWGYTLTTVEQGAEAVESLFSCETTGAYYDGKHLSRAIPQVYNTEARDRLKNLTMGLLRKFI
jgi:NAD(P)-dependent dehydrogenase (short-subunit alcohol dehydrogenase family)